LFNRDKIKMKKLIIFDCDGVLVDSEYIGSRVYAQILTQLGYIVSTEDSIKNFTGLNDTAVIDFVFQESGIKLPDNLSQLAEKPLFEAFENELKPLIDTTLKYVSLNNMSRCIASSSPKNRIFRALELTQQQHFFLKENIFSSSQVSRGKPFPDLFLFAAQSMQTQPKNCLVIEDSLAGIEAAQQAGMSVIAFLGASHAVFDWYKEKISKYNIPIAYNANELTLKIDAFYTS